MKKLSTILICISAALTMFAQYENAAYIGLGSLSGGSSQRVLMYFDSSFNQLGYVTLQTSAYEGANSIAYGAGIIPNSNGLPGMLLQRDTPNEDSNYFTVNAYADPLTAGVSDGAELQRSQPAAYASVFVASNSKTDYIDRVVAINSISTDGILTALVNRYNKEAFGGEYLTSFIYRYQIPATAAAAFQVWRVDNEIQAPRWDVANIEYKDFATGYFSTPYDSEVTEQLALLDTEGLVHFYQVKDNKTGVINREVSMDVSKDGKEIISVWGGDAYSLFVLYDDYTISEYDTTTLELVDTVWLSSTHQLLDIVKVSPAVIPEPAEYAVLFGLFALGAAFLGRRK